MQKLVLLFTRKPGLSRADFFAHYLNVHAPLAVRHHRALLGYVVNLTDQPWSESIARGINRIADVEIDAITENWRTQEQHAFDSPEGQAALVADHNGFMGQRHAFVVSERVRKARKDWRPGDRSPGVKLMIFELGGKPAAYIDHAAVLAWSENVVLSAESAASPPITAFVEARVSSLDDAAALLHRLEAHTEDRRAICITSEYVQIAPPHAAQA